jgi:tRNA (pseudouridine54-N1)-methyltransferase
MREFIYYSEHARTSGNFDVNNLMKAGRMDIACQFIIMSLFVSNHMREDVKLHLIFNGPPDAPKHLEMFPGENLQSNDVKDRIEISKKDIVGLIKKMLYKCKKEKKTEVAKGYSIEKKSFIDVVEELKEQGKEIYLLDRRGEDIRELKDNQLKDAVFIIGDHEGIPKHELKKLKKLGIEKISIGRPVYFASQTTIIIHNELDRREL